ncbi:MAG TPA: MFS transporter [Microbacteriaceae bacterium]|nr:MFS transporter [Microbacteriaceae bacterium]
MSVQLGENRGLRRWRNAVFILFFVQGVGGSTWLSRLPTLRDDTGLTTSSTGTFLLAGSIGALIGLGSSTFLVAKFGAHRALLITMSTGLVGVLTMGFGSSVIGDVWAIALGLFGFGCGFGASGVLINIEGSLAERAIGKTVMPLIHGFFSIGTVTGALIAAGFAAAHVPVVWHFSIMVLLCAGLALGALVMLPDRSETADVAALTEPLGWRNRAREALAVWRDPFVAFMGVCLIGTGFAEGAANDWIALGMVDGHGFSNALGALGFGLFVGGMTLIRLIGGPLTDRWGRVVVYRGSVVCIATGIVVFVFGHSVPLALLGSALWGLGVGLAFPTLMSAAGSVGNRAARVAAVSSVGYASGLVGPPALGWIGAHVGVLNAQLALVPLLAVAFVFGFAALGHRRGSGSPASTR